MMKYIKIMVKRYINRIGVYGAYCKKHALKVLDLFGRSLILFALLAWIMWSFSKYISVFILLTTALRKCYIVWQEKKLNVFNITKCIIIIIIAERLVFSAVYTCYWEVSRGGAKFHFEDFNDGENMKKYFKIYYPINSNVQKLINDIETAGGKCICLNDSAEYKRAYHVHEQYTSRYNCVYENFIFSKNFIREYEIDIYANDSGLYKPENIVNIKGGLDKVGIFDIFYNFIIIITYGIAWIFNVR